ESPISTEKNGARRICHTCTSRTTSAIANTATTRALFDEGKRIGKRSMLAHDRAAHRACRAHGLVQPRRHRDTEGVAARRAKTAKYCGQRFGGVAKRRARLESDGSMSRPRRMRLMNPAHAAAPAGLRCMPAAEPF